MNSSPPTPKLFHIHAAVPSKFLTGVTSPMPGYHVDLKKILDSNLTVHVIFDDFYFYTFSNYFLNTLIILFIFNKLWCKIFGGPQIPN